MSANDMHWSEDDEDDGSIGSNPFDGMQQDDNDSDDGNGAPPQAPPPPPANHVPGKRKCMFSPSFEMLLPHEYSRGGDCVSVSHVLDGDTIFGFAVEIGPAQQIPPLLIRILHAFDIGNVEMLQNAPKCFFMPGFTDYTNYDWRNPEKPTPYPLDNEDGHSKNNYMRVEYRVMRALANASRDTVLTTFGLVILHLPPYVSFSNLLEIITKPTQLFERKANAQQGEYNLQSLQNMCIYHTNKAMYAQNLLGNIHGNHAQSIPATFVLTNTLYVMQKRAAKSYMEKHPAMAGAPALTATDVYLEDFGTITADQATRAKRNIMRAADSWTQEMKRFAQAKDKEDHESGYNPVQIDDTFPFLHTVDGRAFLPASIVVNTYFLDTIVRNVQTKSYELPLASLIKETQSATNVEINLDMFPPYIADAENEEREALQKRSRTYAGSCLEFAPIHRQSIRAAGSTAEKVDINDTLLGFATYDAISRSYKGASHPFPELENIDSLLKNDAESFYNALTAPVPPAGDHAQTQDALRQQALIASPIMQGMNAYQRALEQYNESVMGLYPTNFHMLHLMTIKQYVPFLDFADNAFPMAKNGIGYAMIACNLAGAPTSNHAQSMSKRNGSGADYTLKQYVRILDCNTFLTNKMYPPPPIQRVDDSTDRGLRLAVSEVWDANGCLAKPQHTNIRFAMTEIELKADKRGENLANTLVAITPRTMTRYAAGTPSTMKQDNDVRGQLLYYNKVIPNIEILACNKIADACMERMTTLATVSRMMPSGGSTSDANGPLALHRPETQEETLAVLANMRDFRVWAHSIAMGAARVQFNGHMGEFASSPVAKTLWEAFKHTWKKCTPILSPTRMRQGQFDRTCEQAEARAVAHTLYAIATGQIATKHHGNALYQDCKDDAKRAYAKAVSRHLTQFASVSIDPFVMPSMLADFVHDTLRLELLMVASFFAAFFNVPILPHADVLQWFRQGTIHNAKSRTALVNWWNHRILQQRNVTTEGNPAMQFFLTQQGAFAQRVNMHQGGDAQQASQRYNCSIFQSTSQEHAQVADEIATNMHVHMQFGDRTSSPHEVLKFAILMLSNADVLHFIPFFGKLAKFPSTYNLLSNIGANVPHHSIVHNHACFDEDPHKVCILKAPSADVPAYTFGIDLRWLIWLTSITASMNTGPAHAHHDHIHHFHERDLTHELGLDVVACVLQNHLTRTVPYVMLPAPVVPLSIANRHTKKLQWIPIHDDAQCAKRPQTMPRPKFSLVTTNSEKTHDNHCLQAAIEQPTLAPELLSMQGFTPFAVTGMVEDIALCCNLFQACLRFDVRKLSDMPSNVVYDTLAVNMWTPVLKNNAIAAMRVMFDQEQNTWLCTIVHHDTFEQWALDANQNPSAMDVTPLPHIARPSVLLYLPGDIQADPDDMEGVEDVSECLIKQKTWGGVLHMDSDHDTTNDYAVLVPHVRGADDKMVEYFSHDRVYHIKTRRHGFQTLGLAQVLRHVVPYGSDIIFNFYKTTLGMQNTFAGFSYLPKQMTEVTGRADTDHCIVGRLTWENWDNEDLSIPHVPVDAIWLKVTCNSYQEVWLGDEEEWEEIIEKTWVIHPKNLVDPRTVPMQLVNGYYEHGVISHAQTARDCDEMCELFAHMYQMP